jgi:hypothetical protein
MRMKDLEKQILKGVPKKTSKRKVAPGSSGTFAQKVRVERAVCRSGLRASVRDARLSAFGLTEREITLTVNYGCYGYRRIMVELCKAGYQCSIYEYSGSVGERGRIVRRNKGHKGEGGCGLMAGHRCGAAGVAIMCGAIISSAP